MRTVPTSATRPGTILPLVAISLVALVGLIALAIDIGIVAVARTQLQNIADMAALSGARQLNGDTTNSGNLNNINTARSTATNRACEYTLFGQSIATSQVQLTPNVYRYNSSTQRFATPDPAPATPGSDAWSAMRVVVSSSSPTFFGKIFNVNSFAVQARATAVHRPRDLALILDFSGSMRYGCQSGFPPSGTVFGSLNPDGIYPKFGHYYAMSQRALASSDTSPGANGTGYNPMQRPIRFVDSGGESHAANNLTIETAGGPPIIRDFLTNNGSGFVNAFHQPQASGSYTMSQAPVAMPAPDNFQDQSDSPVTYVGDKWPRKSKATTGTNYAATVQEYLFGTNNNSTYTSNTHSRYVPSSGPIFDDQNSDATTAGYGSNFKGYSMGPGYYGKTFWIWPPDPRTPRANPGASNYVPGDWRERFFKYGESYATTSLRNLPLDNNAVLFDASGFITQPSATTYRVNYDAILAWLTSGPKVLPDNLRAGRVLYYSAIPTTVPQSGGTLDQVFWRNYINYVLGVRTTNQDSNSMYGREIAGWGTVKITAKTSLKNGGTPDGTGNANTVPYMHYNDNPIRPRANFWFGPLTMVMFLTEDNDTLENMWPGTCHESQCWQLKAGVRSALDDIRSNHPNDWATLIFFSHLSNFSTARVSLSRDYSKMKNALFFPFSLLNTLSDNAAEYRPYDTSFAYLGAGNIPNANGNTCPQMAFMVTYNQWSSASGYSGRRGATKVGVFETDGVPNTSCAGTFTNGGPYNSYYSGGIGTTTWQGNNDPAAMDPAVAAVSQICALDNATMPGYSTSRSPARIHSIGFGDLFESTSSRRAQALDFLARIQVAGRTSPSGTVGTGFESAEAYKVITGTSTERIDKLRQALERIMQSGIQVSLIE